MHVYTRALLLLDSILVWALQSKACQKHLALVLKGLRALEHFIAELKHIITPTKLLARPGVVSVTIQCLLLYIYVYGLLVLYCCVTSLDICNCCNPPSLAYIHLYSCLTRILLLLFLLCVCVCACGLSAYGRGACSRDACGIALYTSIYMLFSCCSPVSYIYIYGYVYLCVHAYVSDYMYYFYICICSCIYMIYSCCSPVLYVIYLYIHIHIHSHTYPYVYV